MKAQIKTGHRSITSFAFITRGNRQATYVKIPATDVLAYAMTESITAKISNYTWSNGSTRDARRFPGPWIERHGDRPQVEICTDNSIIRLEIDVDQFQVHLPPVRVVVPVHRSWESEIVKAVESSEPDTSLLSEDVGITEIQYVRPLRPSFRYASEISPAGITFGHLFKWEPTASYANDSWVRKGNLASSQESEGDAERIFFWCPVEWLLKFLRSGPNGSEFLARHFLEQFVASV